MLLLRCGWRRRIWLLYFSLADIQFLGNAVRQLLDLHDRQTQQLLEQESHRMLPRDCITTCMPVHLVAQCAMHDLLTDMLEASGVYLPTGHVLQEAVQPLQLRGCDKGDCHAVCAKPTSAPHTVHVCCCIIRQVQIRHLLMDKNIVNAPSEHLVCVQLQVLLTVL